jgi:mRNA interferase MazF
MKGGMMYDQRDIVLIPFPYSDLTGAKQRPALILSNNTLNKEEDRICCLITSKRSSEGVSISNTNFEKGTLPFQSWVKPHRLFTIHQKIIRKKLCTVTKEFHKKILSSVHDYIMVE